MAPTKNKKWRAASAAAAPSDDEEAASQYATKNKRKAKIGQIQTHR